MNWLDVAGPPGIGKSTLCYPIWQDKAVTSDGLLPPKDWLCFCNEISRLLALLIPHRAVFEPELDRHIDLFEPARRMNDRSMRKMSAVARMPLDERGPFMQTGFVQRGLGFGWRFQMLGISLEEMRPFFRWMPISQGVVFLEASRETLEARNRARLDNPATAHENRTYQIRYMLPAIEVAKDELRKRTGWGGVHEIDVDTLSEEQSRAELVRLSRELRPFPGAYPDYSPMISAPAWMQ